MRSRFAVGVRKLGKSWVWYRIKRRRRHDEYMFFLMCAPKWQRFRDENRAFHI